MNTYAKFTVFVVSLLTTIYGLNLVIRSPEVLMRVHGLVFLIIGLVFTVGTYVALTQVPSVDTSG